MAANNKHHSFSFVLMSIIFYNLLEKSSPDPIKYESSWTSIDSRPLPLWYDESKIGIFLHWGIFSVPSYGNEWFWSHWINDNASHFVDFIENNYPKGFSYQEFAKEFKVEFFNPNDWAELFAKSGAKYVVLTGKHHEGYTLWPSKYSYSWNANDIGPQRDLVGDLAQAVRAKNLTFGLYHSLFEWFNPMYLSDKLLKYKNREYVEHKVLPEIYELVNNYKPELLWSDGDDKAPVAYWNSLEFLAWLYNESPVKDSVVVNDRWGHATHCKHGGYYTCKDRYNPGNILINVGPKKDGTIDPILEERLTQLGKWLTINGEAIYKSKPWTYQEDANSDQVWYTTRENYVYAIVLTWPSNNVLKIKSGLDLFNSTQTSVYMLGNEGYLTWKINNNTVEIKFWDKALVKSENVWVLKIGT